MRRALNGRTALAATGTAPGRRAPGRRRTKDRAAASGQVLSIVSGAALRRRQGTNGRDPGGLSPGHLDPLEGDEPVEGKGHKREYLRSFNRHYVQIEGLQTLSAILSPIGRPLCPAECPTFQPSRAGDLHHAMGYDRCAQRDRGLQGKAGSISCAWLDTFREMSLRKIRGGSLDRVQLLGILQPADRLLPNCSPHQNADGKDRVSG